MTAPLPARLLDFRDAAESTNDDEGNDGRATYVPVSLQTFRQTMDEAAAALSGREAVAPPSLDPGAYFWLARVLTTHGDKLGPSSMAIISERIATTPPPGDGWRPIAEAPRDGTPVLAYWKPLPNWPYPPNGSNYAVAEFRDGEWRPAGDDDTEWDAPTHWMPLPAAPTAKGVA